MKDDLVSIIIPVYNAERFIEETVETVINQTYTNWELLLIDDCSTDKSESIIIDLAKKDKRIKHYKNSINSGAAISRNNGIKNSQGKYICFLDADDKWKNKKLEKQIEFMKEKNCEFSFTNYEFADENCVPNGKKVVVPDTITYKQALKNTTISTITVMFNMSKLSKEDIYMPNVPSEDTATWWKVLKKVEFAYGIKEELSYYRRLSGTLSSNKIKALKRTWNLYRNIEKLDIISSSYNFICYAFNAVKRRI